MGCAFCASTLGGKVRDLTPGEMLEQVLFAVPSAWDICFRATDRPSTRYASASFSRRGFDMSVAPASRNGRILHL